MKRLVKPLVTVALLVAAAFFCSGMFDSTTTVYKVHVVKPGETLNGIAAMYYDQNAKGYIPKADYAMMVRVENNKLYNMDRQLQIGDEVKVPIYVEKK